MVAKKSTISSWADEVEEAAERRQYYDGENNIMIFLLGMYFFVMFLYNVIITSR